jgi:hypothetical protein
MADQLASIILLADSLNSENLTEKIAKHLNKYPIGLIYLDIKRFGEMEKNMGKSLVENCSKCGNN